MLCKLLAHTLQLQRAMSDIYRDLTLLRNFAILNYTGCVKILKKHDKKLAADYSKRKYTQH
jgi:SPX domain protein involved in polyphosphate accumulation